MIDENKKPCLIQTGQGFSVSYNEKFLYSKYNPSKAILQKIESMDFLPGSVILVMSPVLCYGLKELLEKLPENCAVLLCERDEELRTIAKNAIEDLDMQSGARFAFPAIDELYNLPVILQKISYTFECGFSLAQLGTYRRVIRIDFSAGVQFHADFYNELENACVNSVKQFWTNRITISKFGRRFSRNIFRNLKSLPETTPISNYIGKITKPIVVFGSGETSEIGAVKIKSLREDYFILCADTAFPMLKGYGIVPDGIVIDEAQSVIAESFIGAVSAKIDYPDGMCGVQIFQSLCSLPHVAGADFPKKQITFYATEYASGNFFESLKGHDFFPPVVPAFGSVGITSYFLANIFKSNDSVPVTVYGLDFAYSLGKTHAKGTSAHKRQLREKTRIKSDGNFGACFGENSIKLDAANSLNYSTPILLSYAQTFDQVRMTITKLIREWHGNHSSQKFDIDSKSLFEYLQTEKATLEELRGILSGEIALADDERNSRISEICKSREYLYLHFPDGYKFSLSLDFLKRVRGEIDFFLKYL